MSALDKTSEESQVEVVQDLKEDGKPIDENKAVMKKESQKETEPSLGNPETYIKHPLQCRYSWPAFIHLSLII